MQESSSKLSFAVRAQLSEIIIKFHDIAREVEGLEYPPLGVASALRALGGSTANLKAAPHAMEYSLPLSK